MKNIIKQGIAKIIIDISQTPSLQSFTLRPSNGPNGNKLNNPSSKFAKSQNLMQSKDLHKII